MMATEIRDVCGIWWDRLSRAAGLVRDGLMRCDRYCADRRHLSVCLESAGETLPHPAAERVVHAWFKERKWAPDPSEIREGVNALIARCRTDEEREALEPGWLAWKQSLQAGQAVKRIAS